jgi:hypothetical protein
VSAATQDVRGDDRRKALRKDGGADGELAGVSDEFTAVLLL